MKQPGHGNSVGWWVFVTLSMVGKVTFKGIYPGHELIDWKFITWDWFHHHLRLGLGFHDVESFLRPWAQRNQRVDLGYVHKAWAPFGKFRAEGWKLVSLLADGKLSMEFHPINGWKGWRVALGFRVCLFHLKKNHPFLSWSYGPVTCNWCFVPTLKQSGLWLVVVVVPIHIALQSDVSTPEKRTVYPVYGQEWQTSGKSVKQFVYSGCPYHNYVRFHSLIPLRRAPPSIFQSSTLSLPRMVKMSCFHFPQAWYVSSRYMSAWPLDRRCSSRISLSSCLVRKKCQEFDTEGSPMWIYVVATQILFGIFTHRTWRKKDSPFWRFATFFQGVETFNFNQPTRRGKNSHLWGPLKILRISEILYQKPTETNLQMLLAIQGDPPGN